LNVSIATVNPTTGQTIRKFEEISDDQLEACLQSAVEAFTQMRKTTFDERTSLMRVVADLLESDREELARVVTTEMGKTLASAKAEVSKCARGCRYYADNAERLLADEPADPSAVGASKAYARYQPLGVILAVMPWNFPLWQVMRFAAPALMAGNVGLLKHASNVPQTALYLGDVFSRAGFAEGSFQSLLIGARRVEGVIRDERVSGVTLTGSAPAGAAVGAVAGEVVKPSVLELGGSDAFIVLPSADIEKAARIATLARCQNNGQSCIAAKRFIVHDAVFDEFERLFVKDMSSLVLGDPLVATTEVGPLATGKGRDEVHELVSDATSRGARVLCGGEPHPGDGFFYPPTVVSDLSPDMRMYSEEVFGPVAGLFRVNSIDEAIRLANATEFGLGANAWTHDEAETERLVDELEAGAVFINGMVTSYPELPFGGIKASGYGRELAAQGIRAFCNLKTVWVGGD
jgi:succinate-semialdehyde dehydrogenase/glutarate-semialdehyde dehydrogenase